MRHIKALLAGLFILSIAMGIVFLMVTFPTIVPPIIVLILSYFIGLAATEDMGI